MSANTVQRKYGHAFVVGIYYVDYYYYHKEEI